MFYAFRTGHLHFSSQCHSGRAMPQIWLVPGEKHFKKDKLQLQSHYGLAEQDDGFACFAHYLPISTPSYGNLPFYNNITMLTRV